MKYQGRMYSCWKQARPRTNEDGGRKLLFWGFLGLNLLITFVNFLVYKIHPNISTFFVTDLSLIIWETFI